MRYYLYIFLFSLLSIPMIGQDQRAIDSLLKALPTMTDTSRVMALCEISNLYHNDNSELGKKYAVDAMALADKLNFMNGQFQSRMAMGSVYYVTGKLDSALPYFNTAYEYAKQTKNNGHLSVVTVNLGNLFGDKGNTRKCLEYYFISEEYTKKLKRPKQEAYLLVNIATVYSILGQHDSALVFYLQSEKILSGQDKNEPNLPIVYNNIGATYLELKDTTKAAIAFENALRISKLHNNQRGLASAYDHVGVIMFFRGDRDSALAMLKNSVRIYEATESKSGLAEVCVHLGECYFRSGQSDSALVYLNKGMKVSEALHDFFNLKVYYSVLSELYEKKGDLNLALNYHKKLLTVKDTIFNLNNSSIVDEMKTQLANDKKQQEIELLNVRDQKQKMILYWAIAVAFLILLLGILAFNRYLVKKRAGEKLSEQNEEIQLQKNIIEEKNKDITDSIRYAKRIQNAILPSKEQIKNIFADSFVYFRPKDIVSGDFYWLETSGDYKLFSVVDCTGHGVPGAMLSVVGHNLLNKGLHDEKLVMPDKLLQYLNENIAHMLREKSEDQVIQDGMDIALCSYHEPTRTLYYSGSFNSLYIIRNSELQEIKSDKIFIGNHLQEPDKRFTLHTFKVQKGDVFYVFSDGFADQFGGASGKKFKYKPFQRLLLGIQNETMEAQEDLLSKSFDEWRKDLDQVDDVCVIGVKI